MRPRGTIPKHVQLAAKVRRLIRHRRLKAGQLMPTEQELQIDFGCSRGTVRRALDTLVHEGMIRRRQGAGHFVAREGGGDRQALFGLILPNILNAELLRLAQRFTLETSRRGYRIVLGVLEDQAAVEREFITDLHRLKAAGLIKFPTWPDLEPDLRAHIRGLGLPCVILNDFWADTARDHHVAGDEQAALEDAVAHLVQLGHRHIGWVDGSDGPRARALASLRRILARHQLTLPDERILLCPPYETPPVEKLWRDAARAPTALITPYDGMAVRLIEKLAQLGRAVPRDVSVVNLNGPSFYTAGGLDLTTALPPEEEIVARTLEILTNSQQQDTCCHYLIRPRFHVGQTTGPVPSQRTENDHVPHPQ